ncbi:hypothetical protein GH714_029935 [Hevea brasiliensis]|uniref:U-box domain-containing protein n=1 Tax=Hevea brasiliensis TaxID=3981 RepID=A0A6A6K9F7_HEVBR|nr:hypothetical protein GH714_029935 [Hevea brasiliensis]
MLDKLLKVHKLAPFVRSGDHQHKLVIPATPREPQDSPSVLRIVHAGGKVECYYMAIPAMRILEKYPSYVLAKPEVFRRPWDSVVRPEKILTPGQRFFLVPLRTVNKLRRRIRKPIKDLSISMHVTFVGIDGKHKASGSEKKGKSRRGTKMSSNSESGRGERRTRNAIAWKPSLQAINESQGTTQPLSCPKNSHPIVDAKAVSPLIKLLKECKKYSKFAEKATALLEVISNSEEGRTAIASTDGGILTLVETVEDGSLVSMEHAVRALLSLCQSNRDKYRELILKEGAIPGLLRLTVEGTSEAQERARMLLDLLRDTPQENKLASSVLKRIVYDIAARVDGSDKAAETAKRLLQDMVQRSMEHSMDRIQRNAASCTPSEISSTRRILLT